MSNTSDASLIKQLNFGHDSAEDEPQFLQRVFVPTSFFERIKLGQKRLVLGRKGAGKTAVCLRLYEDLSKQNATISLITPRDLSKFKMLMLEKASVNRNEWALMSWKYTFLIELSIYVVNAAREKYGSNYLVWPEDARHVRKFLADNLNNHSGWLDTTFKIMSSIRSVELPLLKVKTELAPTSSETSFTDILDESTSFILASAKSLIENPIYILVDKVDEIWEPGEESKSLIIGLLRASKELNELGSSIKVIIFLRSDIFDSLEFHDSDKFHSIEERVTWDRNDLKKLVTSRARASTGLEVGRLAYDKIWFSFFPAEIEDEDSFEYLLKHTFLRPRDLIQLCNLCRDRAQDRDHPRIEEWDIREALSRYSEWKLRDLRDEYKVQYPFLQKLFLGMFYGNSFRFTRGELTKRFEPIKAGLIKEFGDDYFEPLDNLLQVLYNIGFLGATIQDKTFYTFLDDKVITAYVHEFEIHPVFRLSLSMNSGKEQKTYAGPFNSETVRMAQSYISNENYGVSVAGTVIARGSNDIVAGSDRGRGAKRLDFERTYQLVENLKLPDDEKEEIVDLIKRLAAEVGKGEQADVQRIERWLRFLQELSPEMQRMVTAQLLDENYPVPASIRAVALKTR